MSFHWTDEAMLKLKTMLSAGVSAREIGEALGTTRFSVIGKVHKTPGLAFLEKTAGSWSEAQRVHVRELLEKNASYVEIGAALGCTRQSAAKQIGADAELAVIASARLKQRTQPEWSDEETISQVAEMLREGKSAGDIGAALGLTRNQVIGRVSRNAALSAIGLQGGMGRNRAPKAKRSSKQNLHAGNIQGKRESRANDPVYREPVPAVKAAEYDAKCPVVTLAEHRESQCRWPMGSSGTEFYYCGHPRTRPSVYCAHHKNRSVQVAFRCEEAA